jgi:predicted Rossmann fold nucleotide-binding protein DprA/Smf involved in DNA uptake
MMNEPFHVGVTGSRSIPTDWQQKRLLELLLFLRSKGATTLHHGDCIGADAYAHNLAIRAGLEHIVIHPPLNEIHRAYCHKTGTPEKGITQHEPKPYLTRNRDIVAASNVMIALPKGEEIVRSGTWATVRYARQNAMSIYLIFPFRFNSENDPYDWKPTESFPNAWRK